MPRKTEALRGAMIFSMKLLKLLFGVMAVTAVCHARLGETEAQLVARFGKPNLRSNHSAIAQGKSWVLGPSYHFRQDDWSISCDLVDGRCVRIGYSKGGDWTEDQIALVLASNSQGQKWTEGVSGAAKLSRSWKRSDGATAQWSRGGSMRLVVPAYERAKQVAEAKAKAEASRKPKI